MLAHLTFCRGWFKIGKISTIFQSKTLIPKHKNQIFHKFLSSFPKTSYEQRATRNGYIFVSNAQVALIIEALLFSPPAKSIICQARQGFEHLNLCNLDLFRI